MFLIAGLGNPGRQYEKTRHNMGFDTIDELVERYNIPKAVLLIKVCTEREELREKRFLQSNP